MLHFTRNCRIKNLDYFEGDDTDMYLWRAGLLSVTEKEMTICYIMNWYLIIFLREGKVNIVVLMKHRRKVKSKQVITLQMAQQLKTKNNNVIPRQLFCCQCKAKLLLETKIDCIDDEDKCQSVTDTDDEFTE